MTASVIFLWLVTEPLVAYCRAMQHLVSTSVSIFRPLCPKPGMEENVEELIREAVEAAGVIAEVDEGTEQELVSLAANPQPFPPPVLVEAPDQVQEFQASIAQVTTLFTTYNKVQTQHLHFV